MWFSSEPPYNSIRAKGPLQVPTSRSEKRRFGGRKLHALGSRGNRTILSGNSFSIVVDFPVKPKYMAREGKLQQDLANYGSEGTARDIRTQASFDTEIARM